MLSTEQIKKLIAQGENSRIEFKSCTEKVSASVYETVCSFLNKNGGQMFLGIKDDGDVVGVNKKSAVDMIKNIINSLNNPELFEPTICIDPEVVDFEDKQLIYLSIPESNQVHRYKGKVYDRIGDSDNDISKSHYMIDNVYLRKRKESSESEVCPFVTIEDMDEETFHIMRSHISIQNPEHPWLKMGNEEFLRELFWGRDKQTNQEGYLLAAVLLFGKEQTVLTCCPYHRTDAIYRNMSYERFLHPRPEDPDIRYDDREMICLNIIQSYLRLMNFVNRNLPDKFRLDEQGINRIDVRNLIFREVIANMLLCKSLHKMQFISSSRVAQ